MNDLYKTEKKEISRRHALAKRSSIAVVGSKDTVLIFKALGMDVFFTDDIDVKAILGTLVEHNYSIILITEREAVLAGDIIDAQIDKPYPIILPIPDGVAKFGLGTDRIAANMEKAIGGLGGLNDNK